jgi:hypothetical protein
MTEDLSTDGRTNERTDGHGETSIIPSNIVARRIISGIIARIYSNIDGGIIVQFVVVQFISATRAVFLWTLYYVFF